MTLFGFVGHARALDAREAGALAARQVLDKIGREPPLLGFVFASSYLPMYQVVSGLTSLLGDIPLIGTSSAGEFSNLTLDERSVAIALLAGEQVKAQAAWSGNYLADSYLATTDIIRQLNFDSGPGTFFVVADGLSGDAEKLCRGLSDQHSVVGCLAGAHFRHTQTYQVGGRESGVGGLAAAFIGPELAFGTGAGHGWQPMGESFLITEAEGVSILSLDNKTPVEAYSGLFGFPAHQWISPPLNELVRLYPLGIQGKKEQELIIRSPLCVEPYGNLRMQAPIAEKSVAHIMVGNRESCIAAAQKACKDALGALNGARPELAVVLIDVSWRMLMKTQPGVELEAIRHVLGPDVPIVGGYTYGQLVGQPGQSAQLLNQHIEVVLLGKRT
jgi:hypothetical protein